jgi:hypothetical protein
MVKGGSPVTDLGWGWASVTPVCSTSVRLVSSGIRH